MFDFEKLEVYKKAENLNRMVVKFLRINRKIDSYTRDQLKRASVSMVINIAEGSGKFSKADRRNFYIVSRSSVYECVSLLRIIAGENNISTDEFNNFYNDFEEVSKMLLSMISSQK